jgi:uncharacterized protein with gpF-like domain
MKPKAKDKVLPGVRANPGLAAEYRKRLDRLIQEMHKSVTYWLLAAYRGNTPAITDVDPDDGPLAMDEAPADALRKTMAGLGKRWISRFDKGAAELAAWFAQAAGKRSDAQLRTILKNAGFAVEFRPTPAMRDIMKATINQQVSLIKSIPVQYLSSVEGAVMRSVQTGRDIGGLAKELEQHYGVTKRRAQFISRSQNEIATATMNRARQIEIGCSQAIWCHSHGSAKPRPTHVAAGKEKQVYSVVDGWLDPAIGKRIWPGTEPNCKCFSRSLIPSFQ